MGPSSREPVGAFFDLWRATFPDEAGTLGVTDPQSDLSDPSIDAIERWGRGAARALQELAETEPTHAARLGEERLDRAAITSYARHEVRRIESGAYRSNVELGLEPYHLLRHFLVHARGDRDRRVARARVRAMPGFLAAHEATLARGEGAHGATIDWIASHTVPSIAGALRALDVGDPAACAAAADAYLAHGAFLATLPRRAHGVLGEEETRARLSCMGLDRSIEALVCDAREVLASAHQEMLGRAGASASFAGLTDVPALRAALDARYARLLVARDEEVIGAYEALVVRATDFARERGLVPLEGSLALRVRAMPPAIAEAGHAQNWAAPLRGTDPRADFCVSVDASVHPAMAAPLLAVHEGVPGHSLQSLAFARAHGASPAPVRFLAIADDVAMAHSYFGAMVSIEGWASWVEHRMLELGFYDTFGDDAVVYAWNVRAIRAARVVADLGIHTGAMSPSEAERFLVDEALLPARIAEREVLRYQRIPLQAMTYLSGALAIERALARGMTVESLLAAGPVPPDAL